MVLSEPNAYHIGVDTGGTYTDAVIIAAERGKVIASAKAITTKGDLAIGVTEAITSALSAHTSAVSAGQISLVSVSTTLATNAVVEGEGSPVAAILAGFDRAMLDRTGIRSAFPDIPISCIGGGHDHNGDELAPLDLVALETAIAASADQVEAFAVASAFAVRNPAHELCIREVIAPRTGKPVTLSTELSSDLDAPRRALTAVLNARLISRISLLVQAVRSAMERLGINCPLMVVKGDGTLALAERVALRPIETVLSGPAASLVGAKWLSGRDDFIMCDIGGTTTDLGVLLGGRPKISREGADLGGWRTMVKAIDARAIGLGGDSEVAPQLDSTIAIGPERIVPLALVQARFAEVTDMLEAELAEPEIMSLHGKFVFRPFGAAAVPIVKLSARERDVLAQVTDRPKPMRKIAVSSGAQRALRSLKRKGFVQLSGFTPTDAAHVLGLQSNWPGEASRLGAEIMLRQLEMRLATPDRVMAFCTAIWSEIVRLSSRAVLQTAFQEPVPIHPVIDAACSSESRLGLARVLLSPSIPIVAVGAPARVYYSEVGRRLGAEIVFPPFHEVANAVGAATGVVARAVTVIVDGDGSGVFRVHAPQGTVIVRSAGAAIEAAERAAREAARAQVLDGGGAEPELRVTVERHLLPDAVNEEGLLTARLTAEAVSRPELGSHPHATK